MVAEEREYGGEQAGRSSLTRSNEVLDSPEQRKRVVLYSFRDAQGVLHSFHDSQGSHDSLTQKECAERSVHLPGADVAASLAHGLPGQVQGGQDAWLKGLLPVVCQAVFQR